MSGASKKVATVLSSTWLIDTYRSWLNEMQADLDTLESTGVSALETNHVEDGAEDAAPTKVDDENEKALDDGVAPIAEESRASASTQEETLLEEAPSAATVQVQLDTIKPELVEDLVDSISQDDLSSNQAVIEPIVETVESTPSKADDPEPQPAVAVETIPAAAAAVEAVIPVMETPIVSTGMSLSSITGNLIA